jgi:hypothetical protein
MQKVSVIYKGITVTSETSIIVRLGSDGNLYLEEQKVSETNEDGSIKWPEPSVIKSKGVSMRSLITPVFNKIGITKVIQGNPKTIWGAFESNGWKARISDLKNGNCEVKRVI